ncbi:hypothetical protein BGZ60DRAFT_202862 [Tricladium varicosporioides]|nr:hypothetical protein BGZ60DRAFT_202862 [Hymenoscyphus varicosporioides]
MAPNLATLLAIFPGITRQIALSALDLTGDDLEGAVQWLLDRRGLVERHTGEMEVVDGIGGKGKGVLDDPVTFSDSEGEVVDAREGILSRGGMGGRGKESEDLPVDGGGRWVGDTNSVGGSVTAEEEGPRGGDSSNERSGLKENGAPTGRQQSIRRKPYANSITEPNSNSDHVKALRMTNGYLGGTAKILENIRKDSGQMGVDSEPNSYTLGLGQCRGGSLIDTRGKRGRKEERNDYDNEVGFRGIIDERG